MFLSRWYPGESETHLGAMYEWLFVKSKVVCLAITKVHITRHTRKPHISEILI